MADNAAPQMTEADLTEFAQQLYEWTKTLPEVQQGLLHRILSRAASAEMEDTEGYIIIVGGLTGRNFLLESGRASPLVTQAAGIRPAGSTAGFIPGGAVVSA